MDDTTILGSTLGQVGLTAKKVGQQVVKIPEEMAADVGGQVVGSTASAKSDLASGEPKGNKPQWSSDEERKEYLKNLYGKTDMSKDGASDVSDKSASSAKASAAKPEEQKKLIELRNKLHKEEYYDPTFNPVKKQEERPAEKVENEKKKEMVDLQKKEEKKPQPLAVQREQNKAEMFRGASG